MSEQTHPHILPLRLYLGIGAALLVLTAVTVTVSQIDLGPFNLVIAMMIAAAKALLVAFFFMHLWFDSKVYFSIFAGAVMFLAAFIVLVMFDTQRRGDIDPTVATPIDKNAAMYQPAQTVQPGGESSQAAPISPDSLGAQKPFARDSAK